MRIRQRFTKVPLLEIKPAALRDLPKDQEECFLEALRRLGPLTRGEIEQIVPRRPFSLAKLWKKLVAEKKVIVIETHPLKFTLPY